MIQGICGRTYIGSPVPEGPLSSWENRLRERLATIGSTESALIWRAKATPAGRSISRLSPSTRHNNGTGCIGSPWPTPTVADVQGGRKARSGARADEPLLNGLMTWSTPRASDGEKGGPNMSFGAGGMPLPAQMHKASPWVTPSARDWKDSVGMATEAGDRSRLDQLPRQMAATELATWPTVSASLSGDTPETHEARQARVVAKHGRRMGTPLNIAMEHAAQGTTIPALTGPITNGSSATTEKRGAPNPVFAFWLMGFPDEWISGALEAMQSFRKSRRKSSPRFSKPLELEVVESTKRVKKAHIWERHSEDWYVEPVIATTALLRVERFAAPVLDPCCGGGNIVSACRAAGIEAFGCDLVRRVPAQTPWFKGERNFLQDGVAPHLAPGAIITNPPYFKAKGTETAIRQALATGLKTAAFVDVRFLASSERANGLYHDFPPDRIWVVTPRVSCPPGDYLAAGNKAGNGSSDWCWLVWEPADAPRSGKTQWGWLRLGEETGGSAPVRNSPTTKILSPEVSKNVQLLKGKTHMPVNITITGAAAQEALDELAALAAAIGNQIDDAQLSSPAPQATPRKRARRAPESPALVEPVPALDPAEKPAPQPEASKPATVEAAAVETIAALNSETEFTEDDARNALLDLGRQADGRAKCREVLAEFNAAKISEIKPGDRKAFIAAIAKHRGLA